MATFKDSNGATWLILEAGGQFFGTPDPASTRRYDPLPDDVGPAKIEAAIAAGIETFAKANKSKLTLAVVEKPDNNGMLLLLLLVAVLVFSKER